MILSSKPLGTSIIAIVASMYIGDGILPGEEPPPPVSPRWIRGDADQNGFLDLTDAITILNYLFLGDPKRLECEDQADWNDDGDVEIVDAIGAIFYLFSDGTPPQEPYPACGEDTTEDTLECSSYWRCGTGDVLNSAGMRFILVRAGMFDMGSPVTERGRSDDEVLHPVILTCDFYMSETEVTQGQYLDVMGINPSYFNGITDGIDYGTVLTRAVDSVSWFNAAEFCRKLSDREGRNYRLPYEAEWEYACRAGTQTRFWFGDVLECPDDRCCPDCPGAEDYMWLWYQGFPAMFYPVAMKEPNPWGFHDMHGHVHEWCMDWYGPYPDPKAPVTNPSGPLLGSKRVIRGVNRAPLGMQKARSARRYSAPPGEAWGNFGFRVVLELPDCRYGYYH